MWNKINLKHKLETWRLKVENLCIYRAKLRLWRPGWSFIHGMGSHRIARDMLRTGPVSSYLSAKQLLIAWLFVSNLFLISSISYASTRVKNSTVWRAGLMCASMPSFAGSLDCCETRDLWKNVRNALLDRTHGHTPTQLLWHCITNFYTNVFRLLNTLSCSWSPGIKAIVCPHYYNRILCYD